MAAVPYDDEPVALAYRVRSLEQNELATANKVRQMADEVDEVKTAQAVQRERQDNLAAAVLDLKGAVTWMTRGLIGLCLTIAGSAAAVMFTLGGHP